MALCTLLKDKGCAVNDQLDANSKGNKQTGMQLYRFNTHNSILLQAMTLLNHAGVCMTYTATWDHLLALTQQANLTSNVQSGRWIWAYDNLNIHCSTRHQCQGEYTFTHAHAQYVHVHAPCQVRVSHIMCGI